MATIDLLRQQARPLIAAWGLTMALHDDLGYRDTGAITYEGGGVRVKLESEQGFAILHIAGDADPENWFDVALLMNVDAGESLLARHSFPEQVDYLVEHRDDVVDRFTARFRETRAALRAAEKTRFAEMFPGIERV